MKMMRHMKLLRNIAQGHLYREQCIHSMNGAGTIIQGFQSENVDYLPGTLNLILSAPHGGYRCPPEIPDRDAESWKIPDKESETWKENADRTSKWGLDLDQQKELQRFTFYF